MTNANAMTMTLQERVAATNAAAVPKVEVTIRRSQSRRDQFWILEVATCPFCHRLHQHGGGSTDGPPSLGFRLSHCSDRRPLDYELIEEDPRRER